MKVTPMIFSGDMVRALLDGRKSQTRRPAKARKDLGFGCLLMPNEIAGEINLHDYSNSIYGMPGDLLWVRETFNKTNPGGDGVPYYRADGRFPDCIGGHKFVGDEYWQPSIHMPRWASRLTLRLTGVRIELLQNISESDAKEEGSEWTDNGPRKWLRDPSIGPVEASKVNGWSEGFSHEGKTHKDDCFTSARMSFAHLWNSIYGNWDDNPWVWVLEFEVIRKNVDEVLKEAA